jgi:hypothetical protein
MRSSVSKCAVRAQSVYKALTKASELTTHILVGPTNRAATV